MSDYPEWLIDRVASAIYGSPVGRDGYHLDQMYRERARAALDALGFEEKTTRGILSHSGRYIYAPSPYNSDREGVKTYSRWVASTEWHEEDS